MNLSLISNDTMVQAKDRLKTNIIDKSEKRVGYLEWDEYFMAFTFLELEKDTRSGKQEAAIVLNRRQIVISMATNAATDNSETYEHHAEYRALKECKRGVQMYMTTFPCLKCAEAIIKSGIAEIIYYRDCPNNVETKELLKNGNVSYRQFVSNKQKVEIDFTKFCDIC